ncbi:T9SS type A sorting domain-containing protein [Fulvivirga sp. M361]|uniref:putative Ig domain-containing protein n=1 Tax=Fulvivirga sp. M361 TaxID=2594266 RepID=UPI00117BBDBF|nr:putative Ig domain-containing protein [Fulvivirga sp. M361]TRX57686.1 T9SS type A sorting domain-containing protein [Fulvivirga sp. M361]
MRHFLWIVLFVSPLISWSQESYVANTSGFSYEDLAFPEFVRLKSQESRSADIGFPFKFFGQAYTSVYIGSNGYISFLRPGRFCCGGQEIPDSRTPNAVIAGSWQNLDPERGGTISYQTIGIAPFRKFVVQFDRVRFFNSFSESVSFQIKLSERLNTVEIQCKDCKGPAWTQGLENTSGTEGITFQERNNTNIGLSDDAVIFEPFINDIASANSISLSWLEVSNETGFTLQRSDNGTDYTDIATLSDDARSYKDSAVDPDTKYYYRLITRFSGGDSQIDLTSGTLPNTPADLAATPNSAVGIELTWTENSNTRTGYIIERSLNADDGFEIIHHIRRGTVRYIDNSLKPETTYYYRISAENDQGISAASNVVFAATPARSTLYFVDADAEGTNDGSSWANAFNDLTDALTAAEDGSDIWIAEGIYKPGGETPSESSKFSVFRPGLRIYGGFDGTETSLEDRDVSLHTTILSGDIGVIDDPSDNVDVIVQYTNRFNDNDLQLYNMTIRGAHSSNARGGGLSCIGKVRLIEIVFEDNQAQLGGGLYSTHDVILFRCTFRNNIATQSGGALFLGANNRRRWSITRSGFYNNSSDSWGGAIFVNSDNARLALDTLYINDVNISDNTADGLGGGLFVGRDTEMHMSNTAIVNNNALGSSGSGGGLHILSSAPIDINNTTISGNRSTSSAGGILLNRNSLAVKLDHVTIFNNESVTGGGLYFDASLPSERVQIQNTIIAGNRADDGFDDIRGGITSLGHNLIGNIGSQSFNTNTEGDLYGDTQERSEANDGATRVTEGPVDPLLEDLADNGGNTPTHALKSDSPALNAGFFLTQAFDQRGFWRIGIPDMGAYEFNVPPFRKEGIPDVVMARQRTFSFDIPETAFDTGDELGDIFSFAAKLADDTMLPEWLTFDGRRFTGTPLSDDVSIMVKVTATDLHGQSVPDEFMITLVDAPAVANPLEDQEAFELRPFTFTVPENTFSPGNAGDEITYSATLSNDNQLPVWLTFNETSREFSGTPAVDDQPVTVKVTVTDQRGFFVSDDFEIGVTNGPKVNNGIGDQVAFQLQEFSFVIPENAFALGNTGSPLTYSVTLSDGNVLPSWLNFEAATRSFSGTPTREAGPVTIKVLVTDENEFTASDDFEITMNIITGVGRSSNNELHVHPNPMQDRLHIYLPSNDSETVEVTITTVSGVLQLKQIVAYEATGINLDTSSLKKGMYVLRLVTKRTNYEQKIIKQ